MKTLTACVFAALLAVSGATTAAPPPAYYVDAAKLPFDPIPGLTDQRLWGVHNKAGYRIEVPVNWNGRLVLWAHGFRGTGLELTVVRAAASASAVVCARRSLR